MKRVWLATIAALCLVTGRAWAVDLPPPPEHRREMYAFWQLEFLADGYPGRRAKNGLVPHPIYGTYVIGDYLSLYGQTREARYLEAARHVGDAALARMTDFKGALVFHYTPEMGLTSLPGTFYSGLTQARYLNVLHKLAKETNDSKYADAAARVLKSLSIPVSEGGVARVAHGGIVIEEWPHQMMGDYTLNGWTTAMLLVAGYAEATNSAEARDLFQKNLAPLKALLALYDIPELANSRYRLSGSAQLRLTFAGTGGTFVKAAIAIPGEGTFPFETGAASPWHNRVTSRKSNSTVLSAVLNYASFPAENQLDVVMNAEDAGTVTVELRTGDYTPPKSFGNQRWAPLGTFDVKAGDNAISVSIPWSVAQQNIHPTNFAKVIGGKNYNVYHYLHVTNLRRLFALTKDPIIGSYAEKWDAYAKRWPAMPLYANAGIVLDRYVAPESQVAAE